MSHLKSGLVWLVLVVAGLMFAGTAEARPIFEVVRYGSHPRQYMYVLHATGWFKPWLMGEPRPAMVYFHGGSFTGGGPDFGPLWWHMWFNEVTIVAPTYRLTWDRVTKREIMEDGARALQYLRLHSDEYGLDSERIGVGGYSAGGVIAAWLALHDDIANPASSDPVLRQSSRATVAYLYYTQVHPLAANILDWETYTGAARDLLDRTVVGYVSRNLNGGIFKAPFAPQEFPSQSAYEAARAEYDKDAQAFEHATADDPPVAFLTWERSDAAYYLRYWYDSTGLHSPLLMIPLKNRLTSLGVPVHWGWWPQAPSFVLDHLEN